MVVLCCGTCGTCDTNVVYNMVVIGNSTLTIVSRTSTHHHTFSMQHMYQSLASLDQDWLERSTKALKEAHGSSSLGMSSSSHGISGTGVSGREAMVKGAAGRGAGVAGDVVRMWHRMRFGVCFLHAVLRDRCRFGSMGFNVRTLERERESERERGRARERERERERE